MAPWRGTRDVFVFEADDFFFILGAAIQSYAKQRRLPLIVRPIRIPATLLLLLLE